MSRSRHWLQLYRTLPHPCEYLPGRSASSLFVDPEAVLHPDGYGALLAQGFRRSGCHVYRPDCGACRACVPVRVPVGDFRARRSQRRAWQANRDLTVQVHGGEFNAEHYALFQDYTAGRHQDGDMARLSMADCRDFLAADWCHTEFMEFRLDGRLLAVAVTDRVPDGLSAMYTFFAPGHAGRSLGVYAILSQIEHARTAGLSWLYLGYWIGASRKMRYKGEYRPLELLVDGRWQRFGPDDTLPPDSGAASC